MNDKPASSTLREWREHMGHPVTLAGLTAAGRVLAMAGPFGTQDAALPVRPVYWTILAFATHGTVALVNVALAPYLRERSSWPDALLAGLAAGGAVTLMVLAVNRTAFGIWPESSALPGFVGTLLAITLMIHAVVLLEHRQRDAVAHAAAPPPILERLPPDRRGALVALSVEDHYVRIQSSRGESLLLMRLSDAIREAGGTPGAQVHQSDRVAFGQVAKARREGDGAILTQATGRERPAGRSNMATIREAGLRPR